MNFLNLGIGELLGLVGVVSAGVTALYLLDRSKIRQKVATLRFWVASEMRSDLKHRRKIQQPLSLLLQLLSLALLLTAIAGPQLGVFDQDGADHVILLDTSAWMGMETPQGTLMDRAKGDALAYLNALPSEDRVMLVRADAIATPATAFESNRTLLTEAIRASNAGASSLDLGNALSYAERAQQVQAHRAGEIVFIGAGHLASEVPLEALPGNLRVIAPDLSGPSTDNIGFRKIGLRRSLEQPDTWDIYVSVQNYSDQPRAVDMALQYALSPVGSRRLTLAAGEEQETTFAYNEKVGGTLEARLNVTDSFPGDDAVFVELPTRSFARVVVYSDDPASLRPLFNSNQYVQAEFLPVSAYGSERDANQGTSEEDGANPEPVVAIVFDRFVPAELPATDAIFIQPPADRSPIEVATASTSSALERWNNETPLAEGLFTRDVTLQNTRIFAPAEGDTVIAEAAAGPVIVARENPDGVKQVAFGFHPGRDPMRYELATPLLIGNVLRWMDPETFRERELQAGTVGTVALAVEPNTDPDSIRILDAQNREIPFSVSDGLLRFFAGSPGTVRVLTGDRELIYSLTLPDLAEITWTPPADVLKGVPPASIAAAAPTNLWPWLALAGGLGLLIDWLLFGRTRAIRLTRAATKIPSLAEFRQRKAS